MIIDFLFEKIIVLPHLFNLIFNYPTWPDRVIASCDLPESPPYVEAHNVKPGKRR